MGMFINTNVMAINARRNLELNNVKLGRALEKLSSGLRINRSADDAAGLAISEKMRALIRGMQQGSRNGQNAISMIQTAEGAMNEVHGILQRQRELSVQAGNSTLSGSDRLAIGEEILTLKTEIDNIAARTTFNGLNLLTGSLATTFDAATSTADGVSIVGATTGVVSLAAGDINIDAANASTTFTLSSSGNDVILTEGGIAQTITAAAMAVANGTQTLNFTAHGVVLTLRHDATTNNVTAAEIAAGLNTKTTATGGSGAAATFQVGAQKTDVITTNFTDMRTSALGGAQKLSVLVTDNTSVDTITKANTLLDSLDVAITEISSQRAKLGAAQNQVEAAVTSLGVVVENLAAAESRIRDADIAEVSSELTSRQIMQQAGVAVLAQANVSSQSVLQLLQG